MAYSATDCIFNVDGIDMDFPVISFSGGVYQPTDYAGKPNADPGCSFIHVVLYGTGDITSYNQLANWAATPTMVKDGGIVGRLDTNSDFIQAITFQQAFCVNYETRYDIALKDTGSPYQIFLTISPHSVWIGGDAHVEKKWPGFESSNKQAPPSSKNNSQINNNLSFE